jgi:hypothetical protein
MKWSSLRQMAHNALVSKGCDVYAGVSCHAAIITFYDE